MGLRRTLAVFFAALMVGLIKHRTALLFFHSSSKKAPVLRRKEVADGLVLKSYEV